MSEIRRVGIIGDGQLGRMIVEDGRKFNPHLEFLALGMAGPDSPAAQVGAKQTMGELTDPDAIAQLVEKCDVTTWEIEHINVAILKRLAQSGSNIQPSPLSLGTIQDKLAQKNALSKRGIDVADFMSLENAEALVAVREKLGDTIIVKARRGGYDGRSNLVLPKDAGWSDVVSVFPNSTSDDLYVEKMVEFKRELSLVGVRDMAGHVVTYPVVQTIQEDNICRTVIYDPNAHIPKAAEELGRATIEAFSGAGVIAVEMFETSDGRVLVNEVAPRVHNSGHWTDLGAKTSQFEQHVRAITGAPLGSTEAFGPTVMLNVLKTKLGMRENRMKTTQKFPNFGGHIRWYGKDPRPGTLRKIGHITAMGSDIETALWRAKRLEQLYVG